MQDISSIAFKYNNENRGTNSVSQNGLTSTLSVNNNPLYQLTYDETNNTSIFKRYNGSSYDNVVSIKETSLINEITYFGNSANTVIANNYDEHGRIINQKLNNEVKVSFNYQSNWESPSIAYVTSVSDKYLSNNGLITRYSYNGYDYDRAITFNEYFEVKYLKNGDMEYDFDTEAYVYSSSNGYLEIKCNNLRSEYLSVKYTYDAFNRLSKKERVANSNLSMVLLKDTYSYESNSNLPSSYSQKDIANNSHVYETYSYDNHGNLSIVSTSFNGIIGNHTYPFTSYKQFTYDGFNRIVSESNSLLNDLSRTYSYDNQGRLSFFGDDELSYNNKGQLESFGNINFSYDNYGNRLTKDNDVYEWERGNLLKKIIKDGKTISFTYDYLGRRYKKDTYKETIIYFYEGNKLIGEDHVGKEYIDDNNEEQTYGSFKLRFFYNNDNSLNGVRLVREIGNQTVTDDYIYIINQFGEIIGLSYEDGAANSTKATLYAAYIYDAWGTHKVLNALGNESETETFIGYLNPFRYKGYYYDQETNLYYLMSRYYDPEIGQFISPDDFTYLDINKVSGYHLYAYCNNNPLEMSRFLNKENSFTTIGNIFTDCSNSFELLFGFFKSQFERTNIESKENTWEVKESYRIFFPAAQFFHCFYLKYIDPETKGFFKGSIVGMQFEWILHNLAYYVFGYEEAKDVNLGNSIFLDEGHGFLGLGMKVVYLIINPALGIIDLILGGGWGNDFKK